MPSNHIHVIHYITPNPTGHLFFPIFSSKMATFRCDVTKWPSSLPFFHFKMAPRCLATTYVLCITSPPIRLVTQNSNHRLKFVTFRCVPLPPPLLDFHFSEVGSLVMLLSVGDLSDVIRWTFISIFTVMRNAETFAPLQQGF